MGTSVASSKLVAWFAPAAVRLALLLALFCVCTPAAVAAPPAHEGVASCAGSACHGRAVASGPDIRHDEIRTWQSETGPAGAHSRAWQVLAGPRAQAIATRLGLGKAQDAPACLGCHADHPAVRGSLFQLSDGVGCEACHGGSAGWLASHYALHVAHADNVARGMSALEDPKLRAAICLDCHFGAAGPGQFVTHQIMSAGHPRLAFELDLFSTLQKHYDLGVNYAGRKTIPSGVRVWAVGQAMALDRSLTLYGDPSRGQAGVFPEFYFFDCHSCHRAISDDPKARPTAIPNPGRPIPSGTPPYNDENMIMLSAAAKVAAPRLAAQYEANSRAFHLALATDRSAAIRAAAQLDGTVRSLASAFDGREFARDDTLAILRTVIGDSQAARYTDYAGSAQAVMAIDTLLNAMVSSGEADGAKVRALRPDVDRAYRAVSDPNDFRPAEFRAAISKIAVAARTLG